MNVFTVKEELDKDDEEKESEEKESEEKDDEEKDNKEKESEEENKWVGEKKASGMDTGRFLHLEDKLNRDDETDVRQPLTVSTRP